MKCECCKKDVTFYEHNWKARGFKICWDCKDVNECCIYIDGEPGGRRTCNQFTFFKKTYDMSKISVWNLFGKDHRPTLYLCPDHEFHYEKIHNKNTIDHPNLRMPQSTEEVNKIKSIEKYKELKSRLLHQPIQV